MLVTVVSCLVLQMRNAARVKFANMAGWGHSAIMMTVIICFVTQMLIAAGITVLAPMVPVAIEVMKRK